MAETTLAKLQKMALKQEKQIIELKDQIEEEKYKRKLAEESLKYYQDNLEKIVEKAVTKAVKEVEEKFEKIIKEKDQRIFELETRLNINSTNSSLPSSKDPIYISKICNSRKPTNKSIGGQKGHKKSKLERFNEGEITEIVEHAKDKCPNCNSHNLDIENIKERDELDFEIVIKKKRHKFYEYKCKDCGEIIKSEIPPMLHAENQYGSGIKILATTLYNYGFVSYNRIRKIISGLCNGEIDPCEGYLTKLQKVASDGLNAFVFDVKEELKKATLLYWDDTTARIEDKDKACLRVYTTGLFVLYKAHLKKDTKGMDDDGILQYLLPICIVMHDHLLHNYSKDYQYQNIECNAHITRKLEGITQNTKHNWSDNMKELLESTLAKRKENIENKINSFTEEEIKKFDEKYDLIIKEGLKEYKEFKHQYEFDKEENLLEFMRDYKGPITEWVRNYNLPYSNNLCETLLRMLKTKMKVSYRFQNLKYAEYFANIMTYTETCGMFGINKCEALKRLFEGNPYSVKELIELKNNQND